ncbi:chemotaxis protein MotB [Natronospira proteinivora]|uniref:Chemotaxis protein MotB n=1 Tax=Natronospira proteinivora TaxID=1807133 RepID=A0ABT1G814_9GAMM|nr:OmpA family protein [Natronospira proteinivora]MCP1727434.1 chemotaxis protein MotB [Natronospira proteinivora]
MAGTQPQTSSPARRPKGLQGIEVPERGEEAEGWLITYLDVITLVLTFFVVLLAFSDFTTAEVEAEPTAETVVSDPPPVHGIAELMMHDPTAGVDVVVEDGQVTLHIGEQLLFPSGAAGLTDEGREVLADIAETLRQTDYPMSIEGHTDNVPIETVAYPSNWELSAARAATVLRQLETEGVARERMRAIGYADTQPIASNETVAGRAKNRRVGLVIYLDDTLLHSPTHE